MTVVGASTLRGTEALTCWPDTLSKKVYCLPETQIRDVTEKLLSLVEPTGCYSLLAFHLGTGDTASSSLRSTETTGPWEMWALGLKQTFCQSSRSKEGK